MRASRFLWRSQILDFSKHDFIEEQMIDQNLEITVLLSDDLGGRILDDAGTMEPWLLFHADKVLEYLANSPNAGISLSSRSEQLSGTVILVTALR